MRRGKRFLNNDNLLIYVGAAIFFIFVIALGIIMFMLNKTAAKLENNAGEVAQEQQTAPDTESVSTEIGKSVEEQENASIVDTSTNTTIQTLQIKKVKQMKEKQIMIYKTYQYNEFYRSR